MAAQEISRAFDPQSGSVVVMVLDDLGQTSPHTIYVTGVPDVDAHVATIITDTDTNTALIEARMRAAGWQG